MDLPLRQDLQRGTGGAIAYPRWWEPQMREAVERQRRLSPSSDRYELPFPQARALLLQERRRSQTGLPAMAAISDDVLPLAQRSVPLRLYRPSGASDAALILYLHGGGWCVGSSDTHDTILRHLAQASGVPVCAMDYALAPEHPFPCALLELQAVVDVMVARCAATGARLFLAGDSAGANLVLVEAMRRRDSLGCGPAGQIAGLLLFYGVYGPAQPGGSHAAYGSGEYGLSIAAQERYVRAYLMGAQADWRVFPLMGDLQGLPPVHLLAAGLDLLLDDTLRLHEAIGAAGGRSLLRVCEGVPHGFLSFANQVSCARAELQEAGRFVRDALA